MEIDQLREALTTMYSMELERKVISAQSIPPPSVYVYQQQAPPPQERHSPALVFGILGIIFALAVISQLIWVFH